MMLKVLSIFQKDHLNLNVKEHPDLRIIQVLTWPTDKAVLATLSLEELICWYSGQDHRAMVFLGQNQEFVHFWKWHYMYPLKLKRWWFRVKKVLGL